MHRRRRMARALIKDEAPSSRRRPKGETLDELREQYLAVFGRRADKRWSFETVKAKLNDAGERRA